MAGKGGKGFAQGDWMCAACGDHQFARNTECRKCGGPKTGGMALGGKNRKKPGDWNCPACNDMQFATNTVCRKCGEANPDPAASLAAKEASIESGDNGQQEKPGDWHCPACNDLQFAKNLKCRKCDTPNPDPEASLAAAKASGAFQGKTPTKKPGDWHCSSCGDLQFAKNPACRKCGAPNPMQMMNNMQMNPMMMQMMQMMMGQNNMMGGMMGQKNMMGGMGGMGNMGGQGGMGGMGGGMGNMQQGGKGKGGGNNAAVPGCKWCEKGECWTHNQGGKNRASPY